MARAATASVRLRRARSHKRVLGFALSVAVLAGCASDALHTLETPPTRVAANPATAVVPTTGAASGAGRFDPFQESLVSDSSPREVIANPTLAQVLEPGPLSEFSIGRADAPVTLVKYASLTCPFCRRFQAEVFPALKRDYIDTGKVRFILREFPIGKTSGMATIALRCVPMEKYLTLYERFLAEQPRWVAQEVRIEPILDIAQGVGLTPAAFDNCRQNQAMIDGLKRVKDRGRQLGVIGTPNFFVNGRLVKKAVDLKELRELIDPLLVGSPRAEASRDR